MFMLASLFSIPTLLERYKTYLQRDKGLLAGI
jgi:hypothetical protein